jgi:hypothetical protein
MNISLSDDTAGRMAGGRAQNFDDHRDGTRDGPTPGVPAVQQDADLPAEHLPDMS